MQLKMKQNGILHLPVNTFLVPRLCLGTHAQRLCRLYQCLGGRAAKYAFPGRAWEREKVLTTFQQI